MIFLSTLTDADLGRAVLYTPTGERGTITSWNEEFIYVRYGTNPQGNATSPEDLEWVSDEVIQEERQFELEQQLDELHRQYKAASRPLRAELRKIEEAKPLRLPPGAESAITVSDAFANWKIVDALHKVKIYSMGDLVANTEDYVRNIPGIGPVKLEQIQRYLAARGLSLAPIAPP